VTTAFKAAGFDVTVASAAIGTHRTTTAREVQATVRLADVDVQAYDAIAFLGGPEARQYFQDPAARRIILDAVRTKKTLGALSTAPRILVNSGILVGMSVAANITERQAIAREGGIASTGEIEQVEVNGAVIITATGSRTAVQRFAQQFVEAVRIASETREEKRTRPAEPAR
ncbi:MAG TPA: DJ-1/PfpI family protein, partial [Sedimentisphaerales bacterium]|nr:DJ-1/PfpI family protein [Sedimentisphaerales bacterium]